MRFLHREAGVYLWMRNSVIQEDPGIELRLLHSQQEPGGSGFCSPETCVHQVPLRLWRSAAGQAARRKVMGVVFWAKTLEKIRTRSWIWLWLRHKLLVCYPLPSDQNNSLSPPLNIRDVEKTNQIKYFLKWKLWLLMCYLNLPVRSVQSYQCLFI